MAFCRYNALTRELKDISDMPLQPGDDESVIEVPMTKRDTEDLYSWDTESCNFIIKQKRNISKKEFLKKLTPFEYAAIKNASISNGQVDYYWQLFLVADFIDLDDPDTIKGINALELMGLLSQGRAAEILS